MDLPMDLIRQRMDLRGKSVLDIGFGRGHHLLEFLRHGARVSGVEPSAAMQAHARQALHDSGLPYVGEALLQSRWEDVDLHEYGWEGAFDLVFVHMSPALADAALLYKALQAGRHIVCISQYALREDSLLQALATGFGLMSPAADIRTADPLHAQFNLLYSRGYFPQIQFEERIHSTRHAPGEIAAAYARRLWRGDACTPLRLKALEDTLQHWAVQDIIEADHRDVIGHMLVDITATSARTTETKETPCPSR